MSVWHFDWIKFEFVELSKQSFARLIKLKVLEVLVSEFTTRIWSTLHSISSFTHIIHEWTGKVVKGVVIKLYRIDTEKVVHLQTIGNYNKQLKPWLSLSCKISLCWMALL